MNKQQQSETKGPLKLTSLNFGSAIYKIEYEERLRSTDDQRLSGSISHSQCVITLDPSADAQSIADTIIHESIHFFLAHYGQEGAVNPARLEELVQSVANGVLTVMRLNPQLVKMLQEL